MINNIYRKKLLNAILYFSKRVKYPSLTKIFKLLNYLDFINFKQTGRSVTNNKYYAWERGPVPKDFWFELQDGIPKDFKDYLSIKTIEFSNDKSEKDFIPQKDSDLSIFTPRERKIMDELIFIYKDITPTQISEISHFKNQPWNKTKKDKGLKAEIDYFLAIDEDALISEEEAIFYIQENDEFLANFPVNSSIG